MRDTEGTVLAKGTTDAVGNLCFKGVQARQDLLFILSAGQGHRGEFLLPASLPSAADASESGRKNGQPLSERTAKAPPPPAEPTLKAVTSGLAWIAGLTGLGALYAARRRRK